MDFPISPKENEHEGVYFTFKRKTKKHSSYEKHLFDSIHM